MLGPLGEGEVGLKVAEGDEPDAILTLNRRSTSTATPKGQGNSESNDSNKVQWGVSTCHVDTGGGGATDQVKDV